MSLYRDALQPVWDKVTRQVHEKLAFYRSVVASEEAEVAANKTGNFKPPKPMPPARKP